MGTPEILEEATARGWSDEEVVARVKSGETALYEIIMRRYNQRLYRVARAILRDDGEAEDVMQDAYVRAYQHLGQFAGIAPFSAWLTKIAVHEALARVKSRNRNQQIDETGEDGASPMETVEPSFNPEQNASRAEASQLLEEAVLGLPDLYRAVVTLRDIEGLSTTETAAALELGEENVKVRLHRGHAMMREWFSDRLGKEAKSAFFFMGARCDRVVLRVFARLEEIKGRQSV